jgi:hypothetical protein
MGANLKKGKLIDLEYRESLSGVPEGEWTNEPHSYQWSAFDLQCLVFRAPNLLHWCGYVGVPPGHPAFLRDYQDLPEIQVHGGLTYSNFLERAESYVKSRTHSCRHWWLGFNCSHPFDLVPGLLRGQLGSLSSRLCIQTYRNFKYVRAQTEFLAIQLSEMKQHGG